MGGPAFKTTKEAALDAVYGYAVGLDMTRRDLQLSERAKQRPWTLGKDVEASAPVSAIAPAARIGHPAKGAITLRQNTVLKQNADIAGLVWSVPEIIAHLSGFYHLGPGDLIFTGTPAGVGPVQPGDLLECAIEGVGTLTGGDRGGGMTLRPRRHQRHLDGRHRRRAAGRRRRSRARAGRRRPILIRTSSPRGCARSSPTPPSPPGRSTISNAR